MAVLPPERAAASTAAKYSGIFACVSKLSTVLNKAANSGPCPGKSFLEPPHKLTTSISSLNCATESSGRTGTLESRKSTAPGSRLVNTAVNSISPFWAIYDSTPRPKLPSPTLPILIFPSMPISPFLLILPVLLHLPPQKQHTNQLQPT